MCAAFDCSLAWSTVCCLLPLASAGVAVLFFGGSVGYFCTEVTSLIVSCLAAKVGWRGRLACLQVFGRRFLPRMADRTRSCRELTAVVSRHQAHHRSVGVRRISQVDASLRLSSLASTNYYELSTSVLRSWRCCFDRHYRRTVRAKKRKKTGHRSLDVPTRPLF